MNKSGPIIIIDDDSDDQELFAHILKSLNCNNEVVCFNDGDSALKYLDNSTIKPFLIFSDVRLPLLSGYDVKQQVRKHNAPRIHCVPYLFFTTSAPDSAVCEAYLGSAQGFFIKPYSIYELEKVLKNIVGYWQSCLEPKYLS